jgi:hypothetical protein
LDGLIRSDGGTEGFDVGGNGGSKSSCHGPRCYRKNAQCRMKDAASILIVIMSDGR